MGKNRVIIWVIISISGMLLNCENRDLIIGKELIGGWDWNNNVNNAKDIEYSFGHGKFNLNKTITIDYHNKDKRKLFIDIPALGSHEILSITKDDNEYILKLKGMIGTQKIKGKIIMKIIAEDIIEIVDNEYHEIFGYHIGKPILYRIAKDKTLSFKCEVQR